MSPLSVTFAKARKDARAKLRRWASEDGSISSELKSENSNCLQKTANSLRGEGGWYIRSQEPNVKVLKVPRRAGRAVSIRQHLNEIISSQMCSRYSPKTKFTLFIASLVASRGIAPSRRRHSVRRLCPSVHFKLSRRNVCLPV